MPPFSDNGKLAFDRLDPLPITTISVRVLNDSGTCRIQQRGMLPKVTETLIE